MAADGGVLRLELELADGVVTAATIRSTRPKQLGRLFHGRRADEAAALARVLFTLCGRAHGAAAAIAGAAALGRPLGDDDLRREAVGVLAERVFETLRACVMGWPPAQPHTVAALRATLVAAQALAKGGGEDVLAALRRAAVALGFGEDEPAADTALGRILRDCEAAPALPSIPLDPLTPGDDAAVAAALLADEDFAAAPELPGRRPETGAFARVRLGGGAFAARAGARLVDVRRALAELEALVTAKAAPDRGLIAWGRLGERSAFAAIETARGRLHHALTCDNMDRILIYGMVAPTEWNFHPRGPFVGRVLGARLGRAEMARDAAEKLALLLDPCCAFETAVREM